MSFSVNELVYYVSPDSGAAVQCRVVDPKAAGGLVTVWMGSAAFMVSELFLFRSAAAANRAALDLTSKTSGSMKIIKH